MSATAIHKEQAGLHTPPPADGDPQLSDKDFRFIAGLIHKHSGIVIRDGKRSLVYSRLRKRLRQLRMSSFREYCDFLSADQGEEIEHFINALTTNLTSFFRERHHFEFLERKLLPELLKQRAERRLRIWSAGSSTGEEAYSIAMTVARCIPADWDVKILATDIDSKVLETGAAGIYPFERIASLPKAEQKWGFVKGRGEHEDMVRVRAAFRSMVSFRHLNLLAPWPVKGPFDFVFCRNTVIYFDKPTQKVLFDRFANVIADAGHLFVGHSETLYNVCNRFAPLGNTIYRKSGP